MFSFRTKRTNMSHLYVHGATARPMSRLTHIFPLRFIYYMYVYSYSLNKFMCRTYSQTHRTAFCFYNLWNTSTRDGPLDTIFSEIRRITRNVWEGIVWIHCDVQTRRWTQFDYRNFVNNERVMQMVMVVIVDVCRSDSYNYLPAYDTIHTTQIFSKLRNARGIQLRPEIIKKRTRLTYRAYITSYYIPFRWWRWWWCGCNFRGLVGDPDTDFHVIAVTHATERQTLRSTWLCTNSTCIYETHNLNSKYA